jgi:hypothetical protein
VIQVVVCLPSKCEAKFKLQHHKKKKKKKKTLPSKNSPGPKWLDWWTLPNNNRPNINSSQTLSKKLTEGILSNSFYEATILLISKLDMHITRKL